VPAIGAALLAQAWRPVQIPVTGARGLVAVLAAGSGSVFGFGYLTGKLMALAETPVDRPVFGWAASHQVQWWRSVNLVLTQMGSRLEDKVIAVIAAVVLAVLIRPLWAAPAVMAFLYGLERSGQELLAQLVHRGHPPTTLGTYPSGGCARIIAVWGGVALLLSASGLIRGWWRTLAWTAVAVAAGVEGYTRIYLLKHWASDAAGGWIFGVLVLAAAVAAVMVLREAGLVTARWPRPPRQCPLLTPAGAAPAGRPAQSR
jgi:membrane-associated phospholipid phosphatase